MTSLRSPGERGCSRTLANCVLFICLLVGLVFSLNQAQAQQNCLVPSSFPGTPVVSTATEGSHILKVSPGCLLAVYATTGATAGYLMVFNSITVPADGAVTPIECVYVPATSSVGINYAPQPPAWYSIGISAAFSTTGCFTKTISATAFIHGLVQ